ncbi:hypothetical protein [uncultured Arsenicicoccus sp.]|uniref:hypothetical protein n=1 Tax=uncultured Arsenicicoccus sp. TaxID=491339 RepID=UPI002591B61C|nr:hypothetical protein [uncultured Arsenicicoccus sp.]
MLLAHLAPPPAGTVDMSQPSFVEYAELRKRLDRDAKAGQKQPFEANQDRPVRYQLRDAKYFFVRDSASFDAFIKK